MSEIKFTDDEMKKIQDLSDKSGNITFHDPRSPLIRGAKDFEFFGDPDDYNGNYHIEPKDNMIIFFPSWFEHSVKPNLSESQRISIAFNVIET